MRAGKPWNATRSRAMADPARQRLVLREGGQDGLVGRREIRRIARQHRPAERALALAEQRPDEQRHEAADVEGVARRRRPAPGRAGCCRSRRSPRRAAGARAWRARARPSTPWRARCRPRDRRRAGAAPRRRADRAGRSPCERVVRRGLVGERVGDDAARDQALAAGPRRWPRPRSTPRAAPRRAASARSIPDSRSGATSSR